MTDFEKIRKDYLELADNTSLTTDVLFFILIINSFCKNMGYTPYLPTEINRNKIQLHFPNATTLYIRFVDESKISITNIQNFTKMLHTIANSSEMYGILTNGREFLLLNSRFYNTSSVILRFDLLSKKAPNRQKYFSYLSKRALVDNKSTDNFKMITEFFK